jgi:hypothetical protein
VNQTLTKQLTGTQTPRWSKTCEAYSGIATPFPPVSRQAYADFDCVALPIETDTAEVLEKRMCVFPSPETLARGLNPSNEAISLRCFSPKVTVGDAAWGRVRWIDGDCELGLSPEPAKHSTSTEHKFFVSYQARNMGSRCNSSYGSALTYETTVIRIVSIVVSPL